MKIFKQEQKVRCLGYVEGYKIATVYYNESGELLDYETFGDFITTKNDIIETVVSDFDPNIPFTEIESDI